MSYVVFGKRILNEYLALGTIGTFAAGTFLATRGGSQTQPKAADVPVTASSRDEEAFIRDFVANMEREEAATKH